MSASTATAAQRDLAINRLRRRRPLDGAAVDAFLDRHDVPIVEDEMCTFLYRGEADEVGVTHRVVGLPDPIPMRRIRDTDLWYAVVELPAGSRVEYQVRVVRGDHVEQHNDPLNDRVAHSPVGSSSVCHATGYEVPEWTEPEVEVSDDGSRLVKNQAPVAYLKVGQVAEPVPLPLDVGPGGVREGQERGLGVHVSRTRFGGRGGTRR